MVIRKNTKVDGATTPCPLGQIPVASTTEKALKLKGFRAFLFYLFASILQLGQHLGQQKRNFLHLANQKGQNMATIYPNKKDGKIISVKLKA